VPLARVEGLELKSAEMRNRTEQELAGYRDALALIHDNASAMHLEQRLLLQLYQHDCH